MRKTKPTYLFFIAVLAVTTLLIASCSLTKRVADGESVLMDNKVVFPRSSDKDKVTDINKYIKQSPQKSFLGINTKVTMYNISPAMGRPPVIFDKSSVSSSIKNIKNHLDYLGYYNSTVYDSIKTDDKKTVVNYVVKLGKTYQIDSIVYSAPDEATLAILLKNSPAAAAKIGTNLSESNLEKEIIALEKIYQNLGYFNFTRNYFSFRADTIERNGKALLYVDLKDYTRAQDEEDAQPHRVYTFEKPVITTVRSFQGSRITSFSEDSSRTARRDSLLSVWRMQNDTIPYGGIYVVKRGNIPLVKSKFLDRINLIKSGEKYNIDVVEDTYSRFSSLGLFSSVNIQASPTDSLFVIPYITLQASTLQGYKTKLQGSVNSNGLFGISPEISYFHKNLFHGAELFTFGVSGDFQFKPRSDIHSTEIGTIATLDIPRFLLAPHNWFTSKTLPHTEISLSYNYQDRPEYKRNIFSASYSYTWNIRQKLFIRAAPAQFNMVRVFDLDSLFYKSSTDPFLRYSYKNHLDLSVGFNLYYTTDPSVAPVRNYLYTRFQADVGGNVISLFNRYMKKNSTGERVIWKSPYSQYFRFEGSVVYTFKFNADPSHMLSIRALGGVGKGYGNSKMLPFEKLFWGGGAYSLRGWQARTLGPGSAPEDKSFRLPNQTGDIRLEGNVEYRFPMFWLLKGAVFADAGNIWTFNRVIEDVTGKYVKADPRGVFKFNNFYRKIALDWGVGLRLDITFVVLRLDWGVKVHDPATTGWIKAKDWLRSNNNQITFGIGYPF